MRRLLLIAVLASVLGACGADRPEGIVERWLVSLNQGEIGEPERHAEPSVTLEIAPAERTEEIFDVIEVGNGVTEEGEATVPYRLVTTEGEEMLATAGLARVSGRWRVVEIGPADPELLVPSQGGSPIGRASTTIWLGSLGLAVVLTILSAVAMTLAGGKPQTLLDAPTPDP
jgi:hypothetical protein